MKSIGIYKRVEFETLNELLVFLKSKKGNAYHYDAIYGEYDIVGIREEDGEMVMGDDGYKKVEDDDLSSIVGEVRLDTDNL